MKSIFSFLKILGSCVFLSLLSVQYASASLAQNQTGDPNPCLVPSKADYSSAFMIPSTTNDTLENNLVPQVQSGSAKLITHEQTNKMLFLNVMLKIRHHAQFESCLASINDPKSPNYHHFLNSTTIMPYLPTSGHLTSIASFLASHGFKVEYTSSPLVIKASAPASTVENTFGIKINVYQVPINKKINYNEFQSMIRANGYGSPFYAADSKPQMPSNILTLVDSIQGLDNYTHVRPLESPCSGPYCPQGIQSGYMFSPLYSKGLDGTGQDVAIVDCAGDPNPQGAINTYDAQYQLPPTTLKIFYPDGNPSSYDPSWASESMMDVEAVHTVSPGATIDLIYDDCNSGSPMNGIDYVATNHIASIVSNSWGFSCSSGACSDAQLSSSLVSSSDNRLELDAAQGLTIIFASGDNGATPDGTNLGTDFPASDPDVLSVGATNLVLSGCGDKTCAGYGSETGAQISGGGYSNYFAEPSWQKTALGAKSGRAVPDVSMLGYAPSFWVYSTNSDKCGTSVFATSGWFGCAGTSLSAPLWAGYTAIIKQSTGATLLGNIAPSLYGLYNTTYSCSFHDITTGNNIMNGGGLQSGYLATRGWDPVSGLGSPVGNNLTFALSKGMSCISAPEFPFAQIAFSLSVALLVLLYRIKSLKQN